MTRVHSLGLKRVSAVGLMLLGACAALLVVRPPNAADAQSGVGTVNGRVLWGTCVRIALPAGASSAPVSLPEVWLLFLMVPAAATVWGGSAAGAGAGSAREAAVRGAGAGVVFAVAVVVGEALSMIWITRDQSGTILRLGADLVRTGALACAWGIGGGVLGALLASRRQPAGVAEDPPPATPPSPTSA